jgi:hypothetical protein
MNKKEPQGMIDYLDSNRGKGGDIDVNEMFNKFNSKIAYNSSKTQ